MFHRSHITCAAGLVLAALTGITAPTAAAQAIAGDSEFWLAPPDVTDLHNAPGGEPLYLVCAGTGMPGSITVDLPANGAFVPIVRAIAANGMVRIDLSAFKSQLETRPTNTITNTGLHIVANVKVGCVYEVANVSNTDNWQLQGADALGQEFYIPLHRHAPFANEASFGAPHQAFAAFDIVATQNNTVVSIYSPTPLDGHAALQQFSITLNRGQAYSAGWTGANWTLPSTHPAGAVVLADKPVSVSIKDDSAHNPSGGCYDLLGDQILPVPLLGEDYIAVKGALNSTGDESLVVVATQNNTQLFLDGAGTAVATLFAGEYYRVDLDYLAASANNAAYLHSSKPVSVVQISGFGCEAGLAQLPPLYRGGSRQVDVVRSSAESFFLMLVAPTSAVSAFTAVAQSGSAVPIAPASFVTVPGTGGAWSAARIQLNTTQLPVDSALRVSNALGHFALGVISGGSASGVRFAYASSTRASTALSLDANAAVASLAEPGGSVGFTISIANSGAAAATVNSLVDSLHGNLNGQGSCSVPQIIAPGSDYSCSYSAQVTGNGGQLISHTTTAHATQLGMPLISTDSGSVTVTDVLPGVSVQKSASPGLVDVPGGVVSFTARVSNASTAEALTLTALIDDVHGNLQGQGGCSVPQTIAIGGFYECTFSAMVAGAAGTSEIDTITATVADDETNLAQGADSATVLIGVLLFADSFE